MCTFAPCYQIYKTRAPHTYACVPLLFLATHTQFSLLHEGSRPNEATRSETPSVTSRPGRVRARAWGVVEVHMRSDGQSLPGWKCCLVKAEWSAANTDSVLVHSRWTDGSVWWGGRRDDVWRGRGRPKRWEGDWQQTSIGVVVCRCILVEVKFGGNFEANFEVKPSFCHCCWQS